MLDHRASLVEAVAKELAAEPAERAARLVTVRDVGQHPERVAGHAQPVVHLVVLVRDLLLVEAADVP